MYGYRCEYCEGTAQPRIVKREAFKHRDGFVILEDVTMGVYDTCGNWYYSTTIAGDSAAPSSAPSLSGHTRCHTPTEMQKYLWESDRPDAGLLLQSDHLEQKIAQVRILVEHVHRRLKVFRILSERYRNRRQRFGLRFNLIAGLLNYELAHPI